MTRAFLFPGQGSQAVGMGKPLADAFAAARETFQEVDDALSQKLSRIMWEGPEADLLLTENAQPAIMANAIAVVRVLEKEMGLNLAVHARLVAGHSLGEYSALCAAGAFTLADTARLLKTRGLAMQSAVPVGEGGMTALIGAEIDQAEEVAKEAAAGGGTCVVANDNAPGQVVISGTLDALARAGEIAKAKGTTAMAPNARSFATGQGIARPDGSVLKPRKELDVTITRADGSVVKTKLLCRIDTPDELEYYRHGGILQYVMRQIMAGGSKQAA
jgi:[acyl-carrier-protein] S-malonyltransferase